MSELPREADSLLRQMRQLFEEMISMLHEDESQIRKAFRELQEERDEMAKELSLWRRKRELWLEEMEQWKQSRQGLTAPPDVSPIPKIEYSIPKTSPQPDSLVELKDGPSHSISHSKDNINTSSSSRSKPLGEWGAKEERFSYYNWEKNTNREREEASGPLPEPFTTSYGIPEGYQKVVHVRPSREEVIPPSAISEEVPPTPVSYVHRSTETKSESPYPESFWIYVWPAFGNSAPLRVKPAKIFVYSYYRYMQDVTEKAAKVLNCQPAPERLHEPDGTPVDEIYKLVPNQHYIIFPSGSYYRPEAVPSQLLRLLVEQSKKLWCPHGY